MKPLWLKRRITDTPISPTYRTKWQLMLPTGRAKSSLHIVYLWYDAGRVQTCHSGFEPGDGHACLCRRNTLRFRTRSARRYTICRLKVVIEGDAHFRRSRPLRSKGRGGSAETQSCNTQQLLRRIWIFVLDLDSYIGDQR